jgi:glycerophosphoryl diester phosphodiesterase
VKSNSHTPVERVSASWRHRLILGHRGSPGEFPENTLRSFSRAMECGADGVELDVQRSRDGVPVVIHDSELDRTLGVRGRVAALHWSAIERLTSARVPSLAQVVAWASASGAWLNIEMKAADLEQAALKLVESAGIAERVIFSSFDPVAVGRIGELEPSVRRFLLIEAWDERARRDLERSGAAGVCLRVDAADDATLEKLSARTLPVIVWTVNHDRDLRRLLAAQVTGIITDDPALASRIRTEVFS